MKLYSLIVTAVTFSALAGCAGAGSPALKWAMKDEMQEEKKMVQSGNRRQAIDELSMILDMNPKNEEARFLRAVAYQGLEEFDLAVQDYETILKNNPKAVKATYNLGMIYAYKLNDPRRAVQAFDRFLALAPDHPKAFAVAKVMCSLDGTGGTGESTEANLEADLRKIMTISDPAKRRKALLELGKQNPDSPTPFYLIAKTYEYEGENGEAIRFYEAALEIRPTCAPCHKSLGKLLLKTKRREEAQSHLLRAKLFEDHPGSFSESESGEGAAPDDGSSDDGSLTPDS